MAKCIYCGRFFNPRKGQGDHVLPCRVFGEFEGDVRYRGLCVSCNNGFSVNEQLLAQGSHLGFFRSIVKPKHKRKGSGNLRQNGAHGAKKPQFKMRLGERTILVSPSNENPLDATPLDQLNIRSKQGEQRHIRLFAGMSADRLRNDIKESGLTDVEEVYLDCDDKLSEQFLELIQTVFPSYKFHQSGTTEPGNYRLPGRAEFEFSVGYYQAIAKIAFHYYLCRSQRGLTGSEMAFSKIRRFIKYGGDPSDYFRAPKKPFQLPFGKTKMGDFVSPREWCHAFAVDESGSEIVVFLQLFAGPGCSPSPDHIILGTLESRLAIVPGVWGQVFQYELERSDKYAGTVFPADISRLDGPSARWRNSDLANKQRA